MRTRILEIIKEKPKHFTRYIKNDKRLHKWVNTNTLVETSNYAERIYSALYQVTNVCAYNKSVKKFKSITVGYGFCGRANVCACAKKSVSQKVSAAKQSYSAKTVRDINKKRNKTTINKYGVTNNAQTHNAKARHKEFYANKHNVKRTTSKNKSTKLERLKKRNR